MVPFVAGATELILSETSQYLNIGTGDHDGGEAINVQGAELGADTIVISDNDPNLVSVFVDTGR